jgi:cobalamin synthase
MKRSLGLAFLAALALGVLLLAVLVEPSLAGASDVGKNVGKEVKSWATALILGVAALVGLPVLFRRDVNGGLVLVLLVIVVGGFVFAESSVRQVIRALWQAVGG